MKQTLRNTPRFIAPEVIQSSAMDCGPAALKCFLEGFGIHASYGRLREACQTDVDGTSIDTIEEIAIQLGLDAEQTIVPLDHLLLPEANLLPALVVIRLPNRFNHFVIAWRSHFGRIVQIMDPFSGRRWITQQQFLSSVYRHKYIIPAASWRFLAAEPEFKIPLHRRLTTLGVSKKQAKQMIDKALGNPGWHHLAALDAAVRMVTAIVKSGGLRKDAHTTGLLTSMINQVTVAPEQDSEIIPAEYWTVRPASMDEDGEALLTLAGAVIIRVRGPRSQEKESNLAAQAENLSPELFAALNEPPPQPSRELLALLKENGRITFVILLLFIILSAAGTIFEAALFRALINVNQLFIISRQQLVAVGIIVVVAFFLLLIRYQIAFDTRRLGRHLEIRLRIKFFRKIPRLRDQYFRSRPISDMANRGHRIHHLRQLPDLIMRFLHAIFTIVFITAGIIWLSPGSWRLAVIAATLTIGFPLLFQPIVNERDMRVRSHIGANGRFYLEAMRGLVPIRTHGAEHSIRREHERLLIEWVRATYGLMRILVTIEALHLFSIFSMAILIVFNHLNQTGRVDDVLLLVYWVLLLSVMGQQIAQIARQIPMMRNIILRLLEPLGAAEDGLDNNSLADVMQPFETERNKAVDGVSIYFSGVQVMAAGHTILHNIDLSIRPGTHIAILGESGAGKSTLVGLLLGWHRPDIGTFLVDGHPLSGQRLSILRQETAWVDPSVQLWNRSLLANLTYGIENQKQPVLHAIERADLIDLLSRLPDGYRTRLGEGGNLISGGEGQRIRFGRAALRPNARLVILDEPFRGLDREKRKVLLEKARQLWQKATLLCITHDIDQTLEFDRVIVVKNGQIVEDGHPAKLATQAKSHYREMLDLEKTMQTSLWSELKWRRFRMQNGRLTSSDGTLKG